MGFSSIIASVVLAATTASAISACPAATRIAASKQVGIAYNAVGLGNSAAEFQKVPWGSPDKYGVCTVTIIPDGSGCAVPVATDGVGTVDFAVATRQLFHHLENTDVIAFDNGTVLYSVEIQLGVREVIGLPVSFHGYVYMDFNDDCRIYAARAYADVPNELLDMAVSLGLPDLKAICGNLPVGGQ